MNTGGSEWANKFAIAQELNLSPRRVLELTSEKGWKSKPGQKESGKRVKLRLFSLLDVGVYKAERDAPKVSKAPIDVGEKPAGELATRPKGSAVDLVRLAEAMAILSAEQAKDPAHYAVPLPPWRYITLRVASKRLGLSEAVLKESCINGTLPFVVDGGRRMLRVADVEAFRP